ncbi:MAG: hypothetical protein RIT45_1179 [Pseudomonadota bacterium]|jgi:dinuclear metal center YbgI/SA1388 family protein
MLRHPDAPDRAAFYAALDAFSPFELAEPWDNVGVLLDPFGTDVVERVLLTIDLGEAVADEAIGWGADAIIAYHPPIFSGLKRLTPATAQGRTLLRLITAGLPVVSPHTALDATGGGMAEWLAAALGPASDLRPITPTRARPTDASVGLGRRGTLEAPLRLPHALTRIKSHLGLQHVRVAAAAPHAGGEAVTSFGVCPGAGGDLFEAMGPVDLLLTGEMRHHDVLARVAAGTTVVLTDHTNCERGYLPHYVAQLQRLLPTVQFRISDRDRDPLEVR